MKKQQQNELNKIEIIEPKRTYIIVYDTICKNNNLNIEELGLITKLIALAPTFKPTIRGLAKILNTTIYTIKDAVKGLQEKGFLIIENNTFKGSKWIITQQPIIKPQNVDIYELSRCGNVEQIERLYKAKAITKDQFIKIIDEMRKLILKTRSYYYNNNDEENDD